MQGDMKPSISHLSSIDEPKERKKPKLSDETVTAEHPNTSQEPVPTSTSTVTSRDNLSKFHVDDHNCLGGGRTYQLGVGITTEDEGENGDGEDEDEDAQGDIYYSEDEEGVARCVPD